jgi:hypothetical protein
MVLQAQIEECCRFIDVHLKRGAHRMLDARTFLLDRWLVASLSFVAPSAYTRT